MRGGQTPGFAGIGTRNEFVFDSWTRAKRCFPHEAMLIDGMFEKKMRVDLSDIKNKFYKTVS